MDEEVICAPNPPPRRSCQGATGAVRPGTRHPLKTAIISPVITTYRSGLEELGLGEESNLRSSRIEKLMREGSKSPTAGP